ncbi:sensor domain-containing protein [Dactylosporangium sp. AC04546]|uniref:sensor histidine kinase n=1 Tax=Dactylosporangium sp. AC04546 TaxID=2862460 RepID=UPI001EDF28BF|nr:sensor histidine kinase [Dactylosporangium sp. AC04546]WVK80134.1 sensor domain-containing protein [Dactylosporangium sp. AC04546]
MAPERARGRSRGRLRGRVRAALDGVEHLAGGLATAVLALVALAWLVVTAVACLAGVGLLLVPSALRMLRSVADRERARLSRWAAPLAAAGPAPRTLRAAAGDPVVRREALWLPLHATLGLLLGLAGVTLPLSVVRDGAFPLYWQYLPEGEATSSIGVPVVHTLAGSLLVTLIGAGWVAVLLVLEPGLAWLQAWPGRRLLAPDPAADTALRIARLTATRAAALDAHAAELRRIERSLHDGTQNRLVAVTVLLGAARRALDRDPSDPSGAAAALDRAQDAAEQALAELRSVVRGILPPVLADRSLPDALSALAAGCPVPCVVDVGPVGRCAASVEATAYHVVAEALTNVARHSGASAVTVSVASDGAVLRLRVTDDGTGGADEGAGSGLAGIRGRAEAHDGTFTLASPAGGPTTLEVTLPCGS